MNQHISEMVERWEKDAERGYAQLIKSELSRFNIDEEQGLNRIKVERNTDTIKAILYLNEYPDVVLVSKWYVDGKLAFSIYRKFEIKNEGIDVEKIGKDKFKITENGKVSPYEVTVIETYFAVRKPLIKTPFEHFILNRF